jgi:hypothetical protein
LADDIKPRCFGSKLVVNVVEALVQINQDHHHFHRCPSAVDHFAIVSTCLILPMLIQPTM